jgi:thioester reductase-like protein
MEPFVETIKAAVPGLKALQVPSFDQLLQGGLRQGPDVKEYQGRYSTAKDAKVLILHTSGSTGLPKPIYITNGGLAIHRMQKLMPTPQGRRSEADALFVEQHPMFTMAPFFHAMGAIVNAGTILNKGSLVLLPPERPINAQLIIQVLNQTLPCCGIFAPSVLEQVCETPGGLDALRALEHVFFGGAPLAHDSGDKINTVSRVVSLIGSTEAGLIPCLLPGDPKDWQYFEWAEQAGVDMQPEGDGMCEMVIKKNTEFAPYQGIFHTFPELDEWRTKDLWAQHPEKKGLWLYKGRKDDVLVLNNGEKFNPVGWEKLVESHPFIEGAVVVGQGRFQTGVILEPDWHILPEDTDVAELLDDVWPMIERANAAAPAHGRVWKSKVAFAKKEKPFRRAAKGSIIRRQTTNLYAEEIEALYSNEASDEELGRLQPGSDLPSIKAFLRKLFKVKDLPIPNDASDDADLFSFGVDSLQVLALSTTLSHACREVVSTVSPRDVYAHPTIESLAKWLQGCSADENANAGAQESRAEAMARMVEKYTHDLPIAPSVAATERPEKHTVALTGSTGSLGNYVLQELIRDPTVAHVYCLNRSADAKSRQRKSFEERRVNPDFSKVTFLHTEFGKDRFDLSSGHYEALLQSVDIFIHNAWAVDFNKALESYESVHIAGTRRCVDFSLQSKYRAHIVFISSIASVGNWLSTHSHNDFVPETLMEDHSLPIQGQGYAESKHVASIILAKAAEKAGVPSTIVRAGQLAGPSEEGMEWNRHEWLPSIVISSKARGVVPERLGNQDVVDWVPLDLAAKTVVEVAAARAESSDKLGVAHLINPRTVSWSELVPAVRESLQKQTQSEVKIVPFNTWIEKLKAVPPTKEEVEKVPGVKLVDFYEGLAQEGAGLPRLATEKTATMSRTLAGMRAVDREMMDSWMRQWWR